MIITIISRRSGPQSGLHVSSLTEQVGQLTKSAQGLRTEQEELLVCINSLREQQREVTLSVQTQTEVKQQLTRTVWGLKEEKDGISKSLALLKQEREQLTRTVCGLRDERDQFTRSMSGLKGEKEQLSKSISGLKGEKEKLLESLSSGKEERDQIMRSLQSLQTESDRLSQAVLCLKQERDELSNSLKGLKEQREKEQSSYTLQEDRNKLIKSVRSLREEKDGIELSISCLKKEEGQIKLLLHGLREERIRHEAAQTEERNQKQHLVNPNSAVTTEKTGTENAAQRCQTKDHRGNVVQTKRLHSELCQAEAGREEAERKAAQAADKLVRLTEIANHMEETTKENENLIKQVKELQSKVTGLVREKADALSLKAQIEEQYNILTAQLKAKGSRDDLSAVLISLRTRYNDIRAKYDALLKKRGQTDLDIAPLKAKLSCLVVKCQERNSLLVQMMKAMHRQGCLDSTLRQQVEQLLGDAALQDYTAAFTPGSNLKTRDYIATESTSTRQTRSSELTPAPTGTLKKNANSPVPASPVQEHDSVQTAASPVGQAKKENWITSTAQPSPSTSGPVQLTSPIQPEKLGFRHPDVKGTSSPDLTSLIGSSRSSTPSSSSSRVSLGRRLSSPEKIINLHEQLQKTLMSSYQVFVDGDFHKSVMSSACTKCVLENVDLSVPVHISVQTLGSNGLSSNSVHTTYRNSVRTDHH
ncbi:protein C4orf50 [Nibea albiflora]|uniref:Protein C4orf50 n=1 Tax=Nibea albiflora TaxID=240163 RepID=A0ACB7EP95_NIBAL|nr:protein C4orf50 [Nibea albiflora]